MCKYVYHVIEKKKKKNVYRDASLNNLLNCKQSCLPYPPIT